MSSSQVSLSYSEATKLRSNAAHRDPPPLNVPPPHGGFQAMEPHRKVVQPKMEFFGFFCCSSIINELPWSQVSEEQDFPQKIMNRIASAAPVMDFVAPRAWSVPGSDYRETV